MGKRSDNGSHPSSLSQISALLATYICDQAQLHLSGPQLSEADLYALEFGVFSQALYYTMLLHVFEYPHV